jgi:glycosyltransferase involved in cell wall biosynthesis
MTSGEHGVRLATLDWAPTSFKPTYLKSFPLGLGPKKLGNSPLMRQWLRAEVETSKVNIIHNHGMWMMPNIYPSEVSRGSNCKLVFSPHGTMSSYALDRSKFTKMVFWNFFQKNALDAVTCFHATAESEYLDIRRLGYKQPVCIIPIGVDIQEVEFREQILPQRKQLLFLGRVHPIKGVDILLNAWKVVESKFLDWDLVIAGPDNDGYLAEMENLAIKLQLDRVTFVGSLFGEEKMRAFKLASLYVLPTHSENFGITVAESLATGTPAIVTKGAPWSGLQNEGAGWWVDIGIEPLITCLEEALALSPAELGEKGLAGRDWMLRDFSWEHISSEFMAVYRWVHEGGELPSCVRLD